MKVMYSTDLMAIHINMLQSGDIKETELTISINIYNASAITS
jgi:hypothetical protein